MTIATTLLDSFSALHVLVVGDAMLDVYHHGRCGRLCQEAPVPVVELVDRTEAPGGAANTALNLASLGARVTLLSVVGNDVNARRLADALERQGVDCQPTLRNSGRTTICKERLLAAGQLIARMDRGDTQPLPIGDQLAVASRLRHLAPRCDAIVVSDYDYGTLGPEVIAELGHVRRRGGPLVIGDSKCLTRFDGVAFAAVKPNYAQAVQLLGLCPSEGESRIEQMLRHGPQILDAVDTQLVALTLDQDGALLFERDRAPLRTYTEPNPHSRAAGAGDTYVAALALALAAQSPTPEAGKIAAAAAAIVVGKDGTACCTRDELARRLAGHLRCDASLESLLPILDEYRRAKRRVVLTNGCFDILHRGHITYLRQARALGDVLICGINTDESIRRLKGRDRPINSLEDRMQVLAALSSVDHVVPFDEDTPHRLVKAIRPQIFVKGGDYTRERLPEAALVEELGGRVEIIPLVRERSTTNLISRIREAPAAEIPAPIVPASPLSYPLGGRLT